MNKVIAGGILVGFTVLSTSCVYDPPKNVPTVTLNVKADSLGSYMNRILNSYQPATTKQNHVVRESWRPLPNGGSSLFGRKAKTFLAGSGWRSAGGEEQRSVHCSTN